MFDIGWDFHVLPWQADETWPTLAEFGQRALNASNSAAQDGTEWEGCITMVECYNNMEDPNLGSVQGGCDLREPAME